MCSNIQAWDNAAQMPADIPTFAHYLRLLGYRTCLSGKMHFIGPDQLHGFEERVTTDICPSDFNWTADWDDPWRTMDWFHDMKNVSNCGHCRTFACSRTMMKKFRYNAARKIFDWAREPDKRPFLLVAPSPIRMIPTSRRAASRTCTSTTRSTCRGCLSYRPRNAIRTAAGLWEQYDRGEFGMSEEHVRNARHAYYGSISYVDERIGEVLDALKRAKLMDDTVVIFCADHGDMLGERGLWYKMSFYDWSARVPLIMAGPGVPEGRRIKANCCLVDILPTLVDLAMTDEWEGYPEPPDGESLLPLLKQDSDKPHRGERADVGGRCRTLCHAAQRQIQAHLC